MPTLQTVRANRICNLPRPKICIAWKFLTDHLYALCRSPRGNSRLRPSKRLSAFVPIGRGRSALYLSTTFVEAQPLAGSTVAR